MTTMTPIRLQWGLQPDEGALVAWGARTIQRKNNLDLLSDRQSYVEHEKVPGFVDWCNKTVLPWAHEHGPKLDPRSGEALATLYSEDGRFHARMKTNGSHGYVYIVAWASEA